MAQALGVGRNGAQNTRRPTLRPPAADATARDRDRDHMSSKPRILARRLAAQSRIFRIEAVDLEFSNGERRTFERVLGGRDSVMIVPLDAEQRLLLAREYAAGSHDYQLGFPKGVVDPGEDLLAAADRELREELGLAARDLSIVRRVSIVPGYIQHGTQIVLARDLHPDPLPGDEPEPIDVVPWPLADVDGLLARPDFTEARSVAALFLVQRFLASEQLGRTGADAV
jgi:ADP-ribose diphosphatase